MILHRIILLFNLLSQTHATPCLEEVSVADLYQLLKSNQELTFKSPLKTPSPFGFTVLKRRELIVKLGWWEA